MNKKKWLTLAGFACFVLLFLSFPAQALFGQSVSGGMRTLAFILLVIFCMGDMSRWRRK